MRGERDILNEQFGSYFAEDIVSLDQLSSEEFWQTVIDVQKRARRVFAEDLFPLIRGEKKRKKLPWKPACSYFFIRTNDVLEIKLSFFIGEKDQFTQFPLEHLPAAAVDHLYELMDCFPLRAIRDCRECKKTFVQLKGKKREFCEDRCMNRWHSRERRKADREAYNKNQREIMRKRYEAKQKEKHGPSVKITKKRRK